MRSKLLLLIAFFGTSMAFAQCNYTLELNDEFGEGWTTGANAAANTGVDVTVDGVTTTYTISSVSSPNPQTVTFDVAVTNGDAISIDYRSPALPGEGSFRFLDSEGIVLFDSGFAATSMMNIFTGTAVCPTCPAVDDVVASAPEARQVTLNWTAGGTETAWIVEYGVSPYTPNGTGLTRAAATNVNFILDGLTPETSYDIYVRSDCGNGDIGSARGPATIRTLPSCPRPIGYTPLSVQANEVQFLIQTGGNREQDIFYEIGVSPYTIGSSTPVAQGQAPFVRIPGLMSNTTYDVYVRFNCGPGDLSRYSAQPYTFTTPQVCPDVTAVTAANPTFSTVDLSWTAGGTENLWEVRFGPAPLTAATSTTVTTTTPNRTLTGLSSATRYEVCVTAICGTLDRSVPVCTNFTTPTDYCGSDPLVDSGGTTGNYGNSENITYTICPDNPGDIVSVDFTQFDFEQRSNTQCTDFLLIYNGDSSAAPAITPTAGVTQWCFNRATGIGTGDLLGITLQSSSPSGCLTFVFSSNVSTTAAGFTANVTCAPPPACPAPDRLTISQIYGEGASATWNSNGTETEWELDIQPAGVAAGTAGAAFNAIVNSRAVAINSLSVSTMYDAYVRANCNATDISPWVGPISFSTNNCPVEATPYTGAGGVGPGNDFTNFPGDCWFEANNTPITGRPVAGNSSWDSFDFGGTTSSNGNAALIPIFNSPTVNNDWLISPNFDLGAPGHGMLMIFDVALTLAFSDAPSNFGSDDNVSLVISENNGLSWTAIRVFDQSSNISNTGQQIVVDLQSYSGMVKMGFVSSVGTVSDPADIEFYVDNIRIAQTAGLDDDRSDLGLKAYPNPTNGLLTITSTQIIDKVVVRNLLGQEVSTTLWTDNTNELDISELKSGIYLVEVISAEGRETIRVIKN